jgi:hypothetical protein
MVFERGLRKRAAHHGATIGKLVPRTRSTTERRQISIEDRKSDQVKSGMVDWSVAPISGSYPRKLVTA